MAFPPDTPEMKARQLSTERAYSIGLEDLNRGLETVGGSGKRLHFLLPLMAGLFRGKQEKKAAPTLVSYAMLSDAERFALRQVFYEMDIGQVQRFDEECEEKLKSDFLVKQWTRSGLKLDEMWPLSVCCETGVPRDLAFRLGVRRTLTARYHHYENRARVLFAQYGVSVLAGVKERSGAPTLLFSGLRQDRAELVSFLAETNDPEFWHLFVDCSNYDLALTLYGLGWILDQPNCNKATLILMFQRLNGLDFLQSSRESPDAAVTTQEAALVFRILERIENGGFHRSDLHCPSYSEAEKLEAPSPTFQCLLDGNPSGRNPVTKFFVEDDCMIFGR